MTVGTNALLTEGCPHRAGRDARLRRPARDRPPGPAPALPPVRAEAGAAGAGRAALRGGGAHRPRGSRRRAHRRGGRAARRRDRRGRARGGRDLPPVQLPRSRHEARLAARLREALPGVHVSASHEVLPQFREYERCSTTVIDAYLSPLLGRYLGRLTEAARERGLPEPHVMQSSGGVAPAAEAARAGAWSVLSGPAGGAVGAGLLARASGDGNALGLDMGGTSCDVCVVEDGRVRRTDSRKIGGRPIQLPMVDVHTVGAGGGSIAWRDPGGALRVGPRSAGAEPGPACLRARRRRADRHRRQPGARLPGARLGPRRRRRARPRRRLGRDLPPWASSWALDEIEAAAGDRPRRQPGDGAGAARGHGRARHRPPRLRADAVRRRRADARRGDRRRARDRADPLPARQRRALGARPGRLRAPPRHRPDRAALGRRARRRAARRRGRALAQQAAGGPRRRRDRGGLRDALPRPGLRAHGPGGRARPTRRSSSRRLPPSTSAATATATPRVEVELVNLRVAAVEPGPEPRPEAAPEGTLEIARAGPGSTASGPRPTCCAASRPRASEAAGPCVFELPEATLVLPPGGAPRSTRRARSSPRRRRERRPRHPPGPRRRPARDLRGDGRGPDPLGALGQHQGAPRLLDRALRPRRRDGDAGRAHPGPPRLDARGRRRDPRARAAAPGDLWAQRPLPRAAPTCPTSP